MRSLLRLVSLAALVMLSALGSRPAPVTSAANTLDRPADPVVLTGADVPLLTGIAPGDLVAFRYDGGWEQIPVQVDERAVKDFADIYNYDEPWSPPPVRGITELVYTDLDTYTGPDPDTTLDNDDEIVLMAKDAGGAPPSVSEPAGVITGSGVEITITDPLNPPQTGYVYLFQSDGTLDPGAGQQYVTYDFDLLAGPYIPNYNTVTGPNPEDSAVTTPYYSHHFSDRWISDEIHITAGSASGVDILDRHKFMFTPGNCVRSEDTFSNAEGAFIANKSGPVRALRSYIGANSGPLAQRDHFFYARREDIRSFLRVHSVYGAMDLFDYSPDASGMTYYNDLNTSGVTIDGNPDSFALGATQWEMITGTQGSLVMASSISTDITLFAYTSYYLDDTTPDVTQCTGDAYAYGTSGVYIDQEIPCTDPRLGCTNYLHATRPIYYGAPGLTVADAQGLNDQAKTPLTFTSRPWLGDDSDGDGCRDRQEAYGAPAPEPGSTCTSPGPCYSDSAWYDFYDVPVPANPDPTPSGLRNQAVTIGDVLAVLFYVGAADNGDPNSNGVDYDSLKDGDWNGDTAVDPGDKVGLRYDRSPSAEPNPPWDAGPPDGAVSIQDVLTALAQVSLDCSGPP